MSIQAKLHIGDKVFNVLECQFSFNQKQDYAGRPSSYTLFRGVQLVLEATKDNIFWEWAISPTEKKQAELHFTPRIMGTKTRKLQLIDAFCVSHKMHFKNDNEMPITEMVTLTCGGFKDTNSEAEYSAHWRETFPVKEDVPVTTRSTPDPIVSQIDWYHPEEGEASIEETAYGLTLGLLAQIANPIGGLVTITIKKEDGSAFDDKTPELTFTETMDDEGTVRLSGFKIKTDWQDFKTAEIDKLVATVKHGNASKKSKAIKVVPEPRVVVEFRPNKNWKGEFGFDWIRKGDTQLFGDNKYEDIVSKQYTDSSHTNLETDGNEYGGNFKKDEKLFKALKGEYKKFTIPWSKKDKNGKQTPEDYNIPWMSLLKNEEVELNIVVEVTEKADYIEFEENENFEITPCKIDISGKKKIEYKDGVTVKIKCKQEFNKDQTLTINACKNSIDTPIEAGKIQVWANDKTKQKEKKVVFVQIKTKLSKTSKPKKSNATSEKDRIGKYLKQALVSLDDNSDVVTLDLTSDKDFKKFITTNNSVHYENGVDSDQLEDWLKDKLKTDFKSKYKDYFKAFYFAEAGGEAGGLSGYSMPGEEYVVVFNSANDQTASHEFLHALNLAHSFANKEADKNATYTYKYSKTENLLDYSHHISGHENSRCSLWYWQWVKANNSI